jgi:hypothetical protein
LGARKSTMRIIVIRFWSGANVPAISEVRASAKFITDHTKLKRVRFGRRQTENVYIKFLQNPSSESEIETCGRTDEQTNMRSFYAHCAKEA